MTERRPMIDMPQYCAHLPIDKRGYPVPKFVDWINGEPEFRAMNPHHFAKAIKEKVCWVCGRRLTRFLAFPIGPMCAINRITSEPPNHLECAEFSVKNCPFLSNPVAKRRQGGLPPEDERKAAGMMIAHNPGVTCMWITKSYELFPVIRPGCKGILIKLGEPVRVEWWTCGRSATRAEVEAAIDKGFPKLLDVCKLDEDPEDSLRFLWQQRERMEKYLPR